MNAETDIGAGVYCIINKANNKKYVGSSIDIKKRWQQHKSDLRSGYHGNYHLQRAFDKYGEENFEFEVVAYMDADKALAFEDYLLKNYPTMFEYNIARDAAAPMRGREFSEEHRQKLSEANTGKHRTEETKRKIGKANSGENNYWFGKHHSETTREKMRKAKIGNKNQKHIDIPDEKIKEIRTLREQGYTYEKIAGVLGVSKNTVWRRLNL